MIRLRLILPALLLALLAGALVACRQDEPATPAALTDTTVPADPTLPPAAPNDTPVPPSPTPIPPTPTPDLPLAAVVNGQPIYLETYEQELARYEQGQLALGRTPGEDGVDYRQLVLDALIEQTLIAQEATARGLTIPPQVVDEKIDELKTGAGELANFEAWLAANQWTEEAFREALAAELLRQQVVEQVTADVPFAVEQVRARYIHIEDAATAQTVLDRARGGDDFAFLAQQFSLDRVTGENGGDLGYFARGALLVPELEEAAFGLEPGEVSDIITASDEGEENSYYIVQVTERDPQRPLDPDLRYTLLQETFENWLSELWATADVRRVVETG